MGDGGLFPLVFLAVVAVAFWLLVLRPAKARARAQQQVISALKPGDRILLSSGILGTVRGHADGEVSVEVAPGVVITAVDQAVLRVLTPPDAAAAGADGPESAGTDNHPATSGPSGDPSA